ncbi:chorismate synthase [archaeon]|nr:MAG: chorismate synthase [archaeon]
MLRRTRGNNSGGIQGGISNGEHIVVRVAFKPTSTISHSQRTVTSTGKIEPFYRLVYVIYGVQYVSFCILYSNYVYVYVHVC